jgi:hypothetical protein
MAFAEKQIRLTFQLGTGAFGETGTNQVVVSNLRTSVKINVAGGPALSEAQIRVFGLTPTVYNSLTSIYPIVGLQQKNVVIIEASDGTSGYSTVFTGQILIAHIDLNAQPDVVMDIIAQSALLQGLQNIPQTNYPGSIPVTTALQSLATTMGLTFEPNDVDVILNKPSLTGSARQQAWSLVQAAGIQWNACADGVMAVWKKGSYRKSQQTIPTISYKKDLIGYPSYSNIGISIRCYYNPNITYYGTINLESSLKVANLNGQWIVYGLVHTLEAQLPNGQWMSEIQAQSIAALSGATQ